MKRYIMYNDTLYEILLENDTQFIVVNKTSEIEEVFDIFYKSHKMCENIMTKQNHDYLLTMITSTENSIRLYQQSFERILNEEYEKELVKVVENMEYMHKCISFKDIDFTDTDKICHITNQIFHLNEHKKRYNRLISDKHTESYFKERKKLKSLIRNLNNKIAKYKQMVETILNDN